MHVLRRTRTSDLVRLDNPIHVKTQDARTEHTVSYFVDRETYTTVNKPVSTHISANADKRRPNGESGAKREPHLNRRLEI
jgi:hypothetical protein